jgi:hypothetical protein
MAPISNTITPRILHLRYASYMYSSTPASSPTAFPSLAQHGAKTALQSQQPILPAEVLKDLEDGDTSPAGSAVRITMTHVSREQPHRRVLCTTLKFTYWFRHVRIKMTHVSRAQPHRPRALCTTLKF